MKLESFLKKYDNKTIIVLSIKDEIVADSRFDKFQKYMNHEVESFGVFHSHSTYSIYHYALIVNLKGKKEP